MQNVESIVISEDVSTLPPDFRRVLKIQMKEFIHHIEDNEIQLQTQEDTEVLCFRKTYLWAFKPGLRRKSA